MSSEGVETLGVVSSGAMDNEITPTDGPIVPAHTDTPHEPTTAMNVEPAVDTKDRFDTDEEEIEEEVVSSESDDTFELPSKSSKRNASKKDKKDKKGKKEKKEKKSKRHSRKALDSDEDEDYGQTQDNTFDPNNRVFEIELGDIEYQIELSEQDITPILTNDKGVPLNKPLTPYFIFAPAVRKKMMEEHPNMKLGEIMKLVGEKWKELEDQQKVIYYASAKHMKAQYAHILTKLKEADPASYEAFVSAEEAKSKKKKRSKDEDEVPEEKKKRKTTIKSRNNLEFDDGNEEDYEYTSNKTQSTKAPKKSKIDENSIFAQALRDFPTAAKRTRDTKVNETISHDFLAGFVEAMKEAAAKDREANKAGRPALSKYAMLKDLSELFVNKESRSLLLDLGILSAFKDWLQPLPDNALPNMAIRKELYRLCSTIPLQYISQQLLKQSEVGHALVRLFKHPDENEENKRLISSIVESWSRQALRIQK